MVAFELMSLAHLHNLANLASTKKADRLARLP